LDVTGNADKVTLENYDDGDYGYLRVIVTAAQLRIEYHPAGDGSGAKTPDDFVTVDLATRERYGRIAGSLAWYSRTSRRSLVALSEQHIY